MPLCRARLPAKTVLRWMTLRARRRSAMCTGVRRNEGSSEDPVQKPLMGPGCGVLAVASAKNPVALAGVVLDLEVVPDRDQFGVALPPFPEHALRAVGPPDAAPDATPGEIYGWMVRKEGYGLDPLRR